MVGRICVWWFVSCHIYGIWTRRSKKVWWMLKSHELGMAMQGSSLHREGRLSLCNTAVLWNFIPCLTGYILWKILLDTSFHYSTVALRVWGWQSQKCNSKCPNDLDTEWAIPKNFFKVFTLPLEISDKIRLHP